jgi:hypothetical protein
MAAIMSILVPLSCGAGSHQASQVSPNVLNQQEGAADEQWLDAPIAAYISLVA